MGNQNWHHQGTENFDHAPKRKKSDRRWTLLFIGDHGRVVTLKRFKGYVFLTLILLMVAAATGAFLYWHNQIIAKKNHNLQSSLEILQKQIKALRDEKDILMARLVLAETRVKESLGGTTENQSENALEETGPKKPLDEIQSEKAEVKPEELAVNVPAESEKESEKPESNLSVDIENFDVIPASNSETLKVQFKIKNTTPNFQRVSGHSIVVLKSDRLEPESWLTIPQISLVDGKPTGKQRGHSFAIKYFNTLRLKTKVPESAHPFHTATVYIYTRDGQLLLEKDFAVTIPQRQAAIPEPSPGDAALKVLQDTSALDRPSSPKADSRISESDDPSLLE